MLRVEKMSELLLELKPKFDKVVRCFNYLNILYSVGVAYILSMVLFFAVLISLKLSENTVFLAYGICYLALLYISLIVFVILDKKNFEVTSYKVYDDKIEFEEGFINHKYTTVKFADVKEIHHEQNFFQRKVGLGTIKFVTAANVGTRTGISFVDIENSNEVYLKVKEIIEK